jgi:hypothetical protein
MAGHGVTLNVNFNDSMLNMSANILVVGYFVFMAGKYIVDKFEINVIELIHKITSKIVNESEPHQELPLPPSQKIKKTA